MFGTGNGMIGEEQFDQHLASALDLFRMCLYLHASFNLADTGSLGDSGAFDLNGTYTADRHGVESGIMAEHWDSDPKFASRVPDRRPFGDSDRMAIDGQGERLSFLDMRCSHDRFPRFGRVQPERSSGRFSSLRFSSETNPLSFHPRAL